MATNKLLPFANGVGANVTDYDTWSALSTLLSQGFTTGVARSDYANRVFAQGALASYILGQFVVDQTAQDADLNETTFYTNFKNALLTYIKANSVTLNTNQTIGGTKTFSTTPKAPTATAGDNSTKVATTAFVKKAIDDHTDSIKPVSYGEQTLTDEQKAQARTNIGAIDDTDVVTITTAQTITGDKTFTKPIVTTNAESAKRSTSDSYFVIFGGTSRNNGAFLNLMGSSYSTPGVFRLSAVLNSSTKRALEGYPDGTLNWDGNGVLTSANGVTLDTAQTITGAKTFNANIVMKGTRSIFCDANDSYVQLVGGTSVSVNAPAITLSGNNRAQRAGSFRLWTGEVNNQRPYLDGTPSGSLTWDSKEIERVSESGTGYIKYESGWQICIGIITSAADATSATITFPSPFLNANAVTVNAMPAFDGYVYATSITATGAEFALPVTDVAKYFRYIAIGKWK